MTTFFFFLDYSRTSIKNSNKIKFQNLQGIVITNQSSNRVQYKMLITLFLLRLLGICLFWDEVLLCSPGWPGTHGNPPSSGILAMHHHSHLCGFSLRPSHRWKLTLGPWVELPGTDDILNFIKIPGCLCVCYLLPVPFSCPFLAFADLGDATFVSACHSWISVFTLLKWFGFYENFSMTSGPAFIYEHIFIF